MPCPVVDANSPPKSTNDVAVKSQIEGTVLRIQANTDLPSKTSQMILVPENIQPSGAKASFQLCFMVANGVGNHSKQSLANLLFASRR